MNAFLLLVPFFLIRFGLLSLLSRQAVRRAARFAPLRGPEKTAYVVYKLSNAGIVLGPLFLSVRPGPPALFCAGVLCYGVGLALCAASVASFAFPGGTGLNTRGMYRFSRHPMYVAYFVCFAGVALLTRSPVLFCLVLAFQISAHWIVLAEERWCLETFGDEYRRYMEKVRRYL